MGGSPISLSLSLTELYFGHSFIVMINYHMNFRSSIAHCWCLASIHMFFLCLIHQSLMIEDRSLDPPLCQLGPMNHHIIRGYCRWYVMLFPNALYLITILVIFHITSTLNSHGAYLFVCLSVSLSFCMFVRLSIYLSDCLSVPLSIYLSVYLAWILCG